MKNFLQRLSSRRFLLTVGGIIGCTLYPDQADNIVILVGMFVGGESAVDTIKKYKTEETKKAAAENGLIPDGFTQDSREVRPGDQYTPASDNI